MENTNIVTLSLDKYDNLMKYKNTLYKNAILLKDYERGEEIFSVCQDKNDKKFYETHKKLLDFIEIKINQFEKEISSLEKENTKLKSNVLELESEIIRLKNKKLFGIF